MGPLSPARFSGQSLASGFSRRVACHDVPSALQRASPRALAAFFASTVARSAMSERLAEAVRKHAEARLE